MVKIISEKKLKSFEYYGSLVEPHKMDISKNANLYRFEVSYPYEPKDPHDNYIFKATNYREALQSFRKKMKENYEAL